MANKVMSGQRRSVAVQKKATAVRRANKPKTASAVVLVLRGSTALRRRKSAEALAELLHAELFRVDVSAVVSQYIAETEKNLNNVFDKAEASGSILFFDEADALFGVRDIVDDSHNRFENQETAHFLHCIERHNGIVILTTDGKSRIERAFLSRTQVVVMMGTTGNGRMRK